MQDLEIALIQSEIVWEDVDANLALFSKKIEQIKKQPDIIVLPEMFTTGFSMNASSLAQDMSGTAVSWIRKTAVRTKGHLVGSVIIQEDNKYYNRLLWGTPDGDVQIYDKRHLFRYAGEEKVYSSGNKYLTIRVNGWNIRAFICYDLRFPVWVRNIDKAYDAAIFIANWPKLRAYHWKALLAARAIENQSFVVGVNRVGIDGNGIEYSGDSSVINPMGDVLFTKNKEPFIHQASLSSHVLKEYRQRFPAWMDADRDLIIKKV